MTISTSSCGDRNHLEISFEVDEQIASTAYWLADYFENQVADGICFEEDQIIQIGWMLVKLRSALNGLEVWEPDFDAMPIRWCRGVNNTLRHTTLQRSVCEILGCSPVFPCIRDAGIISPDFIPSEAFVMSRDDPSNSDSGWVFADRDYHGRDGEFISLYQIAIQKVNIIPFLALPGTAMVRVENGNIEARVADVTVHSKDNELLRRLSTEPIIV